MGTVISHKNAIVLVIETDLSKKEVQSKIVHIHYDRLELVRKIPRDPRHFSKIDYGQISNLLG